jgi:hypothetical protein
MQNNETTMQQYCKTPGSILNVDCGDYSVVEYMKQQAIQDAASSARYLQVLGPMMFPR